MVHRLPFRFTSTFFAFILVGFGIMATAPAAVASGPTITIVPETSTIYPPEPCQTCPPPPGFTAPGAVTVTGQRFTDSGAVQVEVYDATSNVYVNGNAHYTTASPELLVPTCREWVQHLCVWLGPLQDLGGQFTYFYRFYNSAYSQYDPRAYPVCGHLFRVRAFDYQQGLWSNSIYYITCQ
jgi:hypothetical protein